jgi:hypothetical protein
MSLFVLQLQVLWPMTARQMLTRSRVRIFFGWLAAHNAFEGLIFFSQKGIRLTFFTKKVFED